MIQMATFISKVTEEEIREKTKEDFLEYISGQFDNEVNEETISQFEEVVKEVVPGYHSLTAEEKAERAQLQELAKNAIGPALHKFAVGQSNVPDIGSIDRAFQTLFLGMGNEQKDIAQKKDMAHVIKEGTAEERHELFLDTMNRLAEFPMEQFRAMSMEQKLENLPELLPTLVIGMDGEGLLRNFEQLNCDITEEEKKQFTALFAELNAECLGTIQDLDMLLNPYYPHVDCTQIPLGNELNNELDEALQDRQSINIAAHKQQVAEGLEEDEAYIDPLDPSRGLFQLKDTAQIALRNQGTQRHDQICDVFKAAGLATSVRDVVVCTAEGELLKTDGSNRDLQQLQEGKTVYYTSKMEGAEPTILAFRDLNGNGVLTRVPFEVKKPNGFIQFFDRINRAFGGKGLESVNKYNEYVENITALKEETKNLTVNDRFNAVAEKVKKQTQERKADREKATALEAAKQPQKREAGIGLKNEVFSEREKEFAGKITRQLSDDAVKESFDALTGHDKMALEGNIGKQRFEDLLVLSALVSPAAIPQGKVPRGMTEEMYIQKHFTGITQGLLNIEVVPEKNKAMIAEAKRAAAEAMNDFRNGKPEKMAELLGHGLKQISTQGRRMGTNAMSEIAIDKTALQIRDILQGNENLMKHAKLTAEDLKRVEDISQRVELHNKYMEAVDKMEKAWASKQPMAEGEKKELMADMMLDAMLRKTEKPQPASAEKPQAQAERKDVFALLSFDKENLQRLKEFIKAQPEFQNMPDFAASSDPIGRQGKPGEHTPEVEKAATAMEKAFLEKVNAMTEEMKQIQQIRADKQETTRLYNQLSELRDADIQKPAEELTRNEKVMHELRDRADDMMRSLTGSAMEEGERQVDFNHAFNLEKILMADVVDKMIADHEKKFGDQSVPAIVEYLESYTDFDLTHAMEKLPEFQDAAKMRGTELVKLLRDPVRRNALVDSLMPGMVKGMDNSIAEKRNFDSPEAKFNDPERRRIDAEAAQRKEKVDMGSKIAEQVIKNGTATQEQKEWILENPAAIRDGFMRVKKDYLADKKAPYTSAQNAVIENFDKTIKLYNEQAAEKKDSVALARLNLDRAAPEAHDLAVKAAKDLLTGQQTPEGKQWAAENPELVCDALTTVKHAYALEHDNALHDDTYYQFMHNADKAIDDMTTLAEEKSVQINEPEEPIMESKESTFGPSLS